MTLKTLLFVNGIVLIITAITTWISTKVPV